MKLKSILSDKKKLALLIISGVIILVIIIYLLILYFGPKAVPLYGVQPMYGVPVGQKT